jgi:hypothetical protein
MYHEQLKCSDSLTSEPTSGKLPLENKKMYENNYAQKFQKVIGKSKN